MSLPYNVICSLYVQLHMIFFLYMILTNNLLLYVPHVLCNFVSACDEEELLSCESTHASSLYHSHFCITFGAVSRKQNDVIPLLAIYEISFLKNVIHITLWQVSFYNDKWKIWRLTMTNLFDNFLLIITHMIYWFKSL